MSDITEDWLAERNRLANDYQKLLESWRDKGMAATNKDMPIEVVKALRLAEYDALKCLPLLVSEVRRLRNDLVLAYDGEGSAERMRDAARQQLAEAVALLQWEVAVEDMADSPPFVELVKHINQRTAFLAKHGGAS